MNNLRQFHFICKTKIIFFYWTGLQKTCHHCTLIHRTRQDILMIMHQMFRHIVYRQTHIQLGMVEVEPFDVGGRFGHVGSIVDLVEGKPDIPNSLTLFDLTLVHNFEKILLIDRSWSNGSNCSSQNKTQDFIPYRADIRSHF